MRMSMNAAEALYGFAGWLTSRKERIVMSASDNASPAAVAVQQFIDENGLGTPRKGWENNLIHPGGECSEK